jgi:hypothetical protein
MAPGPVAAGNGLQAGKKSAITGILMTSFAAFGWSSSSPSSHPVSDPRVRSLKAGVSFGVYLQPARRIPNLMPLASSSDTIPVSSLVSRR